MSEPRRSAAPLLRATGLSLGHGRCELLTGVDVTLAAGELLGVLGPNGAGKTTLLRTLSGGLPALGGQVEVGGRRLTDLSPRDVARRVAVLPQEAGPLFPMSVLAAVLLGRAPWRPGWSFETDEDVRIARASLEAVDAGDLAGRDLMRLSGGERQRVLLARALAQRCPVLLCDEPTARLDMKAKGDVFRHLRRQAAAERAVLVVTHELELAAGLCDRLLLLGDRRVVAQGRPADVLTAAHLRDAYGIAVRVDHDPEGRPRVVRDLSDDTDEGASRGPGERR